MNPISNPRDLGSDLNGGIISIERIAKHSLLNVEKRQELRMSLYRGELSPITFRLNSNDYIVQAYDLSVNGIGVILDHEIPIPLGSPVQLKLPKTNSFLDGYISHTTYTIFNGKNSLKIGVRFCEVPRLNDSRSKSRFLFQSSEDPAIQFFFSSPKFFRSIYNGKNH